MADFHRRIRSDCEIHLPLEGIDADNKDANLIAYAESLARSSADQSPLRRLEYVKVIRQRRDVDEPGYKSIGQFDHQAVIADIDNRCAENLRVALVELTLEKLEFLHADRLDFGIGCGALGH